MKIFNKRKLIDLLTLRSASKKELEDALEVELAQQEEITNLHINNRRLITEGNLVALNWQSRQTYDGDGITSIDWHSRRLLDEQPVDSLHWYYRTLNGLDGQVVAEWTKGFKARSGSTALRSNIFAGLSAGDAGVQYFDTDLGIPIWWDGTQWVNANGAAV